MRKILQKVVARLALALSAFLCGCFDYEEKLVFAPDYSGYVDIEYTVPVYSTVDRSMIAYMPIEESKLRSRYAAQIADGKMTFENFSLRYSTSPERLDPFPRKGTVKYRIRFKNPHVLELALMGKTTVYWRDRRLQLMRVFPAGQPLSPGSGRISRRIQELTFQTMHKRSMKFLIIFPWYYDLFTNYGSILKPGIQQFNLPFESTMNAAGDIVWTLEIKANPEPRAVP